MKPLLVIALALTFVACDDDTKDKPEVIATKAQCRDLFKHIVSISPQNQGQDPATLANALPAEDIAGCVGSEPEIRACMLVATDIPAVKKCIPPDDVLNCMHAAAKVKAAAHEKAEADKTTVDPALDTKLDAIRAKCWAGDGKAADQLKTT